MMSKSASRTMPMPRLILVSSRRSFCRVLMLQLLDSSYHTVKRQETVPVGCVPPACWPYPLVSHVSRGRGWRRRVSATSLLDAEPPGGRPPWMQTPQRQTPWRQTPLDADLPGGRPCPLWTEWDTRVKTLPCPKLRLRAVKMGWRIFLV